MHYLFLFLSLAVVSFSCQSKKDAAAGHAHETATPEVGATDTLRKSVPKETHGRVGQAHITVQYTAPVTKGRVIWGGLVPYNEVWATGAHRATAFTTDQPLTIGNQTVPSGKYAIFTIPGQDAWTFILNSRWDQHLADEYNVKEDVLRLNVVPEATTHRERLYYALRNISADEAVLEIGWEKIKLNIPVKIPG